MGVVKHVRRKNAETENLIVGSNAMTAIESMGTDAVNTVLMKYVAMVGSTMEKSVMTETINVEMGAVINAKSRNVEMEEPTMARNVMMVTRLKETAVQKNV